jgi:signal transduction histidine kinase
VTGAPQVWTGPELVWALCLALGVVTTAAVACRSGASRPTVTLLLLGAALLAAGLLGSLGVLPAAVADPAALGAVVVVLPLACLWVPDPPPRALALVAVPVIVVLGGAAAVSGNPTLLGTAALVVPLVVASGVWWRFERGAEREPGLARDRLRWVALGVAVTVVLSIPLGFVRTDGFLVVLGGGLLVLVLPAAVVCAYRVPAGVDVRLVVARAAGLVISVVVAFAVWSGVVAGLSIAGVDTSRPGIAALVAAGVAVGFTPVRRLVDRTVDLLLFGDRPDPVRAASHFATELADADDPVAVLRALREVLDVPSAAVRDEAGRAVLSSGDTPAGPTYALPLTAAGEPVGALVLGLRDGDAGPSSRDRPVLRIVVPALAQLVRAQGLAQELQASRARVVEAVEEDRDRLRRELHDGLGPALTGVAYAADAVRNLLATDAVRAAEVLEDLRADATDAIGEVRRLVDGLRPVVLDDLGLPAALRRHCLQLRSRGGEPVQVSLDLDDPLTGLGPATELAVFRIVTEALTNVARHAGVDRAAVRVRLASGHLEVVVGDPGRTDGPVWTAGGGLRSMRERVDQLGGQLEVGSGPDGGRVRVLLPTYGG